MALRYLALLFLWVLSFDAKPSFSFSFERFEKNRSFGSSEIELYGDAEISDSLVKMFSKGRVMYKKPIRFLGTNPGFSTYFAFSISESLDFLIVPKNVSVMSRISPGFLAVKFVTDPNGGHVEIDIGGEISGKSSNFSTVGLVLNSVQKLHCWIDYDGVSKNVEVRISKSRALRPVSSLVSCSVDLSSFLWREAMYVGISSSSGHSARMSSIYSWSFVVKHGAPYIMHSEPLDPQSLSVRSHQDPLIHERRIFHWRILMALLLGAVCGALVAFVVCFLQSKVVKRHPVAPVEYPVIVLPMKSGYEKIVLDGGKVVDNSAKMEA